ncbi:unnamed protein product [Owenia fusiformis]|uniref:Pikachurin n=1 Tax=Owenia fusiformis TaxID=6347 RepID=A0A8S4N1K8_OWEFU|nr:unnamed protein product [Owenia fusiformis]
MISGGRLWPMVIAFSFIISEIIAKQRPVPFFQGHCKEHSVCRHICVESSPGGYHCECKHGYSLHHDGFDCVVAGEEESSDHMVDPQQSLAQELHPKAIPYSPPYNIIQNDGAGHQNYQSDGASQTDNTSNEIDQTSRKDPKVNKAKRKRKKQKHQRDKNPTNIQDDEEEGNVINELGLTIPPVRFHSCRDLICHNGGQCVRDEMRDGYRCQCLLNYHGQFCEQESMVRYPRLIGSGYVAFPVLRNAYKEFSATIEFRPELNNGLLLFSSEHVDAKADFFSVALIDGYAEFRFDCGTGPAVIKSSNKIILGQWNRVTVHRDEWNGWMRLNGAEQVKGRSKGIYSRITLRQDLYLGGYTNSSAIGPRVGMRWGFVGCIRKLQINHRVYDMRKGAYVGDAIHGIDVSECSAHICDNVLCANGGTCQARAADDYICLCQLGTIGRHCEEKIEIHVPKFHGNSYLQYNGLRRTALTYTDIDIVFKPEKRDGLILYNGYTLDRTGDFISLALQDGFVEFRFDLGTGPAIIRSKEVIDLGKWHEVKISRTGREGYMQVDKQDRVEGMSMGAYVQLTLLQDLFLGGHRNFDETNKYTAATDGFTGCIQKVTINDKPLKLFDELFYGINVENCDHPCVTQPCINGGHCVPFKDFYKCSCPLGFESEQCEFRVSEPILVPMFQGESYLLYSDKELNERVAGNKIDIQIKMKTSTPDGLIFWSSHGDLSSSADYIALGLSGGHIRFSYNLGSGEVIIQDNHTRIDDGKWHKIKAQRVNQIGYVEIDGKDVVEGTSPGRLKQLQTDGALYIGGIPDMVHRTHRKYTKGFIGCIHQLTLATDYHVQLTGEASDGQNIQPCS